MTEFERQLRGKLGIPDDAQQVLVFAESSHWDPNWLHTSQEYYRRFVERNLDQAIDGLLHEPRRIYSVECMFFLRMYWERRPDRREQIRQLINERRLRLTSSGVTTADTLLPSPEAILRDFLLGQEWLRRNGLIQEPRLAYFSDSFGSSPALPSLLNAAGFSQTAITRIDGMYFLGFEINNPRRYPRPGSSAELLLKRERTLDFVWRDRAGAQVLCHWNAFTYGQGDMLAHRGISRIYVFPVAVPDRSSGNIARRIKQFVGQLDPYSRTPYLFCPIGFDFVSPIPNLVALLDRYNRTHYPSTGVWVVNAGLDDYLDLVDCHRDRLPVIELDPNPYWTGFYTARPALKKRCHELVEALTLAESLTQLPHQVQEPANLEDEFEQTWWTAAAANHHDFITGTSPDRIVYQEQRPWLEAAHRHASQLIERLAPEAPEDQRIEPVDRLPRWSRKQDRIEVHTEQYSLELDESAGGAIVQACDAATGESLFGGRANDMVRYRVTGGLWRMGYEFGGGAWKESGRASDQTAELDVNEREGGLEFTWISAFDGEVIERSIWLDWHSPRIHFRLVGRAGRRRTILVRFETGLDSQTLCMDTPGGIISRPMEKVYSPTFWSFQHFVHVRDQGTDRGLALFQRWPGAVSLGADGALQVVALRNATIERAYGLLPVPGNPAKGYEKETFAFEYALEFTRGGDWAVNQLPTKAYAFCQSPWADPRTKSLQRMVQSQIILDRQDVHVLADKPASRGPGRVIRLYTHTAQGEPLSLRLNSHPVREAYLCDARERDIHPLQLVDGQVELLMPGSIASVRLIA